jgi:hypothetical protein
MNYTKKGIIVATIGTAVLGGAIFLVIRKVRNNAKFTDLMLAIQQGAAQQEGKLDYLKAFSPVYYNTPDPKKRPILLYKAAKVEELITKLEKASPVLFTDENTIYSIYNSIESQKKMSQIANAYAIKYGQSLLERLTKALDEGEREKLFAIAAGKPDVQIQKT